MDLLTQSHSRGTLIFLTVICCYKCRRMIYYMFTGHAQTHWEEIKLSENLESYLKSLSNKIPYLCLIFLSVSMRWAWLKWDWWIFFISNNFILFPRDVNPNPVGMFYKRTWRYISLNVYTWNVSQFYFFIFEVIIKLDHFSPSLSSLKTLSHIPVCSLSIHGLFISLNFVTYMCICTCAYTHKHKHT